MADSTPPARRSNQASPEHAASSEPKHEPRAKKPAKGPPRHKTVEVQLAWLEIKDDAAKSEPPQDSRSRRGPPPLPGASIQLPPMPVSSPGGAPVRHHTMEVEMGWVELVDEATHGAPTDAKKGTPEATARPAAARGYRPVGRGAGPGGHPRHKPIRREEEDE